MQFLIPCTSYTRHHQHCYQLPHSRIYSYLFSFFCQPLDCGTASSKQSPPQLWIISKEHSIALYIIIQLIKAPVW